MNRICAVFEVNYDNLSVIAFKSDFTVVYENKIVKPQVLDDEGDSCDDLMGIKNFVLSEVNNLKHLPDYYLKAINFTCFAGAVVHLDANNEPVTPLYHSHKNLGYRTRQSFIQKHGDEELLRKYLQIPEFTFESAALQVFWLKSQKPDLFKKVKYSVTLTQYLQGLFTKSYAHEVTFLGAFSGMYDFEREEMHAWVKNEHLHSLELPIVHSEEVIEIDDVLIGQGIYHKIASVIPFERCASNQFILLNTGVWTTCLNPYNRSKANLKNLNNDSFNVLSNTGKLMRMSKLFSGDEHNRQIKYLAEHFNCPPDFYLNMKYDRNVIMNLRQRIVQVTPEATELGGMIDCPFMERNINNFATIEEAYHQFIMDLIAQQVASIKQTFDHQINRKIYIEGGLAQNEIFITLMSEAFHDKQLYKVEYNYLSAMGAAICIGQHWGAEKVNMETLTCEPVD